MAVDANVLIFERMREEWKVGKSISGSINAGYNKAFSTILDANVTTLVDSDYFILAGKWSHSWFCGYVEVRVFW